MVKTHGNLPSEILRAQHRRSFHRLPLEQMPPPTASVELALAALATKFIASKDHKVYGRSNGSPAPGYTDLALSATIGIDVSGTDSNDNLGTLMGESDEENGPPCLVDESSDEEWRQCGEIFCEYSSADTEKCFGFLT